jgi:hypothetical protein
MRSGNCEIAGNCELYNAYFPAINRMINLMRELQNDEAPRRGLEGPDHGTI